MTLRRLHRLSVALAVVALVSSSAASAGRGDPQQAFTKVDQARAKRMLVRAGDLAPGFMPQRRPAQSGPYCAAADESDLTLTGKATSPQYTLVDATRLFVIAATAQIYRTARQATTSWRRGTSPAGTRCAKRLFTASKGMTLRSFRKQPFPKLAPRTIAYRLVVDLATRGGTIRTFADVIVLQQGRAQAALSILSGGRPLVRSETVAFARTVAARMAAEMRGP